MRSLILQLILIQLTLTLATFEQNMPTNELKANQIYQVNENESIVIKCPVELNAADVKEEQTDYDNADMLNQDDYELAGLDHLSKVKKSNNLLIVQWFKDENRINRLTSNRYRQNGVYLRISNINSNDAGQFKCKLINGFGTASSTVTLNVIATNKNSTTTKTNSIADSPIVNDGHAPAFFNLEKMGPFEYSKVKGSQIRLRCRASGSPKPDILWYKDGIILSEEEYGITRSKWTLELKNLHVEDSGNYTCHVFNKHGYINATYKLDVFEDNDLNQLTNMLEPVNITILAGMDAVLNCRVKSDTRLNLKWMKQISRAEYANYVIQNNAHAVESFASSGSAALPIDESVSSLNEQDNINNNNINNKNDEMNGIDDSLQGLYQASTLAPLSFIEKKSDEDDYDSSNDSDDLTDLNSIKDDFKFEFYVPDEANQKEQTMSAKKASMLNTNQNSEESVHYITLSSSPFKTEKMNFFKYRKLNIKQLIIKQADVKDTGIYVCFGDNSKLHRKTYLKVIPRPSVDLNLDSDFNLFKIKVEQEKPTRTMPTSFMENIQSVGFLIILIPVFMISSFALASICYLRQINKNKYWCSLSQCWTSQKNPNKSEKVIKTSGLVNNREKKPSNTYCCCPSSHILMQENYDDAEASASLTSSSMCKKNGEKYVKSTLKSNVSSCCDHSHMPTNSTTLSDSSSSSTTATTVAYYTTIPVLADKTTNSSLLSPPPPLPNTQPPTLTPESLNNQAKLKRAESQQSMAYYKIVDCDLIEWNNSKLAAQHRQQQQQQQNEEDIDDGTTCVSANSRFYYQLANSNK